MAYKLGDSAFFLKNCLVALDILEIWQLFSWEKISLRSSVWELRSPKKLSRVSDCPNLNKVWKNLNFENWKLKYRGKSYWLIRHNVCNSVISWSSRRATSKCVSKRAQFNSRLEVDCLSFGSIWTGTFSSWSLHEKKACANTCSGFPSFNNWCDAWIRLRKNAINDSCYYNL